MGVALAVFGFGTLAAMQVNGISVHSLNAYVDQGTCWAVINKATPIQEPAQFCTDFNLHFGAVFSGFWLMFGGVINWFAWRRASWLDATRS